jgi:WD40 repeat protein
MVTPRTGTARAVEVLHDRGAAAPVHMDRWTGGSGYLIGGQLVLTAAHAVDYRRDLSDDERLLVRTIEGAEFAARVVLVSNEPSGIDLALLEISDSQFGQHIPPVSFAQVDRDSPVPVPGCWAVGFPRFSEADPISPGGTRRETWHVRGDVLPGGKRRRQLLAFQVTTRPQLSPEAPTGSPWEGMSGAVMFAPGPDGDEHVIGVVITHHRSEGESALTVVPITAVASLQTAAQWWQRLGVADSDALPVLPLQTSRQPSRLTGERAMKEHWDPRGRGVERAARPGWFFAGRRHALSQLVGWLATALTPADNVRVVTGGPGSGKSAVLARLVTMANLRYRASMPGTLAADDPVADLPPGVIDVAVHARAASTGEVVSAVAAAVGVLGADLDSLIERLLERRGALTIVVDALDEADDPQALALTLRRLAGETGDAGVRLLVGTRPGGPHRRLISALGLSSWGDDPALIDLDEPEYLSRDDLAEYVRRRLLLTGVLPAPDWPDTPYREREDLAEQVADAVARAAYPSFLIGQLVSRALLLRAEPLGPSDLGWQQFPKTVADAMDQYLASVGSQTEQDRVEEMLRPLAYARGDGLPLDHGGLWPQLATALARSGRRYTAADLAGLLDTAADYLIETVVAGQTSYYRLYHQALTDRIRERDQHPRPVSAAQIVYQCLLGTVSHRPGGARNWLDAHPYLHSQIAGHAADVGQLASLLDDPEFLAAASPTGLFAALQRSSQPPTGNAQIYRHAYPHLASGPDKANERASYLQLAAVRQGDPLADQLGQLPLHQPWAARWVREPRPRPHYIAGRHNGGVQAVAIGVRRGRPVVVSGGLDRTVRVWDLDSGELVLGPFTGHNGGVQAVAIGVRRGRPVVVSGGLDRTVRVWDLDSGELVLGPLTGHNGRVYTVAVGERQGRPVIASGSSDGAVRVWDLDSGELVLGPLTGHNGRVYTVAVGERRGRPVIASGSSDCAVRVWDLDSGELVLGPLTGHNDWVYTVAVGERRGRPVIASGSYDRTVRVWDLESGELVLGPLTGHNDEVQAVAMGDRRWPVVVSSGSDHTVRVWDLDSGGPTLLTGHNGRVSTVAVGVRKHRPVIVSGSYDRTVRVWDLESGELVLGPLTGHDGRVSTVAVGVRKHRPVIVSGSYDRTVRVWDLESGELVLGPLTGHDGEVQAVAVGMRRGRPVIASGSYDRTIRVWDLDSGELVFGPFTSHGIAVSALTIAVRLGCPVIVSGGFGGTVRVWDLESGELVLGPLTGHSGGAQAVAVGVRQGRPVIVSGNGGDDGIIRVWDLESGELVLGPLTGNIGGVHAVTVSERQGRPVIVSGSDRAVHVWDLESERQAATRIELDNYPLSVASVSGTLAIGTAAGLLRIDLT